MSKHPSRSDVQQETEAIVVDRLNEAAAKHGITYGPETIGCFGEKVKIDAVGRKGEKVVELVDIYARQGKLKGGQLKKPTDDAARLMLAARALKADGHDPRLRLVWCHEGAVEQVKRGWRGQALIAMGVEIEAITLPKQQVEKILKAQQVQYR